MKKIFSIFAAALVLFGAVSCKNKKDDPSAPKGTFTIEISDIQDESCAYTIIPSDNTKEYMYMFLTTEQLGNNLVKTVEAIMTFSRMTYSDYKNNGYIKQGPFARDYSPLDLSSLTEYVLAVFHIDAELNVVGDVVLSDPFYTLPSGFIDLGLPSGILWATYTSKNSSDESNLFTWEEANNIQFDDGKLPTEEQYKELLDNCSWSWSPYNKGYYVSHNGHSIFLACSGKYEIKNNSGAITVKYDADGVDAGCFYTCTMRNLGKQQNGVFLFFSSDTENHRLGIRSQPPTDRLGHIRIVCENPNKVQMQTIIYDNIR